MNPSKNEKEWGAAAEAVQLAVTHGADEGKCCV